MSARGRADRFARHRHRSRGLGGSLRRYADTGAAVLAITHDVSHLVDLGVVDRMLYMRDGRIRAAGSADEMRALEDPYVRGFFPAIPNP
ncbi:hypothetical protein [Saccharopolyspora sp. NPDC049357]|uniref:hypothetical protein n=1 Tax=Saccharopolyspora sp. NPDC049357 TaxID=3154507 RepID=UPI003415DFD3